ncbi:TIGR03084 family metal-binding protein [Streptomyces sp. NPDC059740]|uniref:TIGR03084 family metal-binding protein n=1 Tax=Streptomyces sp. NPDC059740 TaxID=3346926 RepID=UPI003666546A
MVDLTPLLADLDGETADLDALVRALPGPDWNRATPAPGWTVAHQIAHLAWTDALSLRSLTAPEEFSARTPPADAGLSRYVEAGAEEYLCAPDRLLRRWRAGARALADALAATPADGRRLPWFGTAMSPASMVTARIMETWAHGQDVADALGRTRTPGARLRHIAHLGHRTFAHGFAAHGLDRPDTPVRVELTAPDDSAWHFGPADAPDRVTGPALDFCLLVTQRRHPDDLDLRASGAAARQWLHVAQAFAGPPGVKRRPSAATTDC